MKFKASMSQEKKNPKSTNFREVEQRLEAARATVERIWAPSAEEIQRILQARALALAQEPSLKGSCR